MQYILTESEYKALTSKNHNTEMYSRLVEILSRINAETGRQNEALDSLSSSLSGQSFEHDEHSLDAWETYFGINQ